MIKITRNIYFVLLLILVCCVSCTSTVETDKQTKSFIWEISSDINTIYILGSVHVAKNDLYPLDNVIEDAYNRSENIVVEVDINNISEQDIAILLMEKGVYPPGESLEAHISSELYSRLSERLLGFDPSGFLLSTMNSFEPWVISIAISDFDYMELGYTPEYGVDLYFLEKATIDNKGILELESAEFQLDLFNNLPDEIQVMMLEDAVDNPVTKEEMELIFSAWIMGNTIEMEQIIFSEIKEHPEYRNLYVKILDERNFLMLDTIEGFLQDDLIHFVVVGAGHLVGENGLINLLAEKGYIINQL